MIGEAMPGLTTAGSQLPSAPCSSSICGSARASALAMRKWMLKVVADIAADDGMPGPAVRRRLLFPARSGRKARCSFGAREEAWWTDAFQLAVNVDMFALARARV